MPGNFPYKIRLLLIKSSPIRIHNIIKPHSRNRIPFPRPPRIITLRSPVHKAIAEPPNPIFLKNWQMCIKIRVCLSCHELWAYDGSPVELQFCDCVHCAVQIAVCMECYYVTLEEYVIVDIEKRCIGAPKSCSQWLWCVNSSCPSKYLFQKY